MSHDLVVKIIDHGETDEYFYVVYPYYEYSVTLHKYVSILNAMHGFKINNMLILLRQLVEAITHLHSKNVVHRDIKPQNVIVVDEKSIYLIDF